MLNKMEDKQKRILTYTQAIKEAIDQAMEDDSSVFVIGEGVADPKGIFGTTLGLREKYGMDRVLEMPVAENGLTGMCVGAAITGLRPILTHQRVDFALLSLDQLFNNAAKWYYMFGGQLKVPFVVRMVIGQGWGQGAQHSQSLQALFAHIPGLKVVMPTTAYDAKGMLIAAIKDNNPVIFIEHRWLHNTIDHVPEEKYEVPLGKSKVIKQGVDVTIASISFMTLEALKAAQYLEKYGISVEIVDVRSLRPLDDEPIICSVKKTHRLLVLDTGNYTGSFAGEIISRVSENAFSYITIAPQRITLPDIPTPSTPGLTKYYYPHYTDIVSKVLTMIGREDIKVPSLCNEILDVPDQSFTGPF